MNKKTLNLKIIKSHTPKYEYKDIVPKDMNDINLKKVNLVYNNHSRWSILDKNAKESLLKKMTKKSSFGFI